MKNIKLSPELDRNHVLEDYRTAVLSREMSLLGRKEVLSGKAKFGIFGDGKELAQIALSKVFEKGDWRSGYYRDQTLMMAIGALTVKQFFAQLYADTSLEHEPASGGRQMNAHFATRYLNEDGSWKNQLEMVNTSADASPTASQMARLLGLAYASKYYRCFPDSDKEKKFSKSGREIAFGEYPGNSKSPQSRAPARRIRRGQAFELRCPPRYRRRNRIPKSGLVGTRENPLREDAFVPGGRSENRKSESGTGGGKRERKESRLDHHPLPPGDRRERSPRGLRRRSSDENATPRARKKVPRLSPFVEILSVPERKSFRTFPECPSRIAPDEFVEKPSSFVGSRPKG